MSEILHEDAPATSGQSAWWRARCPKLALAVLEPLSIATLYIYMLAHSWLRWMDPVIDFPRELYFAWRMSQGDLLYDQLANWYGPLAQLVQAAGFRIFGVGLDTMVWMNIAVTAGVLLLLREIFRELGGRLMGWLASVVFLCLFAFSHYSLIANYNFLAPYVSQATYSFAGLLLVLWALLKHLRSGRPVWLGVAGVGLAMAYLDKPEAVLAAAGALGVYFLAQTLHAFRHGAERDGWRWLARSVGWLVGGFFCLWLPVFGFFLWQNGFAYAVHATDYVLVSMLDRSIRETVLNAKTMRENIGFDKPWENFVTQAIAGGWLVLVCGVMAVAAGGWQRVRKFGLMWWVLPGVVVAAGGIGAWMAWQENYWVDVGPAFVFPACIAAGIFSLWSLGAAWKGRAEFSRVLGLAVVGVAASLMLARMILLGRITHYGFFMMPLALLFWVHLVAVEAARVGAKPKGARYWLLPVIFSVLVLTGAIVLGRLNLSAYDLKNYQVGEGRDHFYTFDPQERPTGWLVNVMVDAYKQKTPAAKTLVGFPEGIMVNYLLRVQTPLAELEFHPVALGYVGPQHVLDELKARPPQVVFLFHRDLTEYGVKYFGENEASGKSILLWLNENYKVVGLIGSSPNTVTGHAIDLLVPMSTPTPPNAPGLPLLPAVGGVIIRGVTNIGR